MSGTTAKAPGSRTSRILVIVAVLIAALGLVAHVVYAWQPIFIDEGPILRNHLRFVYERTLVPDHAKYPTFYYYVSLPATGLTIGLNTLFGSGESLAQVASRMFLFDRLNLAMGPRLFNVALLYAAGAILFMTLWRQSLTKAGGLAVLLMLSAPGLLSYTAYALPDVLLITLAAGNLLCLYRYQTPSDFKYFLTAVALAGLAVSTKYNAAALVLSTTLWGGVVHWRAKTLVSAIFPIQVLVSAITLLAFFLLGSPGWVLDTAFFADELRFELEHAAEGHTGATGVPFYGQMELLLVHLPVLFLLVWPGAFYAAKQSHLNALIPLGSFIAAVFVAATSEKQSFHYLFPAIPAMVVLSAHMIQALEFRFAERALWGVTAIALLSSLWSVVDSARFFRPNATALAQDWIHENVRAGARVVVEGAYVPKLYSVASADALRASRLYQVSGVDPLSETPIYDVREHTYDLAEYEADQVEYIVTSPRMFGRFFEFGHFTRIAPSEDDAIYPKFERRRQFYEELFASEDWQVIYEIHTGNGPDTLVFKSK